MGLVEVIRLRALAAYLRQDSAYNLRYVMRWFSRTFHTPLADVEALPLDFILEAFYETLYENMPEHQLEDERALLAETEAERQAREAREEADAVDEAGFLRMTEAEARGAVKKAEPAKKSEPDPLAQNQKPPGPLLPDIDIKFVPPEDLEAAIEAADSQGTDNLLGRKG